MASESIPGLVAKSNRSPALMSVKRLIARPEAGPLVALIGLMVAVSLYDAAMVSPANLGIMARAMAHSGIIAVGMAFLLIAGEIDLSAGSVGTLAAVLAAYLMVEQDWAVAPAVLSAIAAGILFGAINAIVTVKIGLTSFITTLGTHFLAFGVAMTIAGGNEIRGIPKAVEAWGNQAPLGTSPGFLIFLALVVVGSLVLLRTVWGAMVIATGGSRKAARVAGINTDLVKMTCFVLVSTLAAVAGVLSMARHSSGDLYIGRPWQLTVIAITVMGGVSLLGGVGTIWGTFLGACLVQVIRSSLVMLSAPATVQDLVIGVFLIIAATLDVLRRRVRSY